MNMKIAFKDFFLAENLLFYSITFFSEQKAFTRAFNKKIFYLKFSLLTTVDVSTYHTINFPHDVPQFPCPNIA